MISEKYHLDIGINTNCVEIEKLIFMIKNHWINRVIVGLDYFDGKISKNSPVGISSKQILKNILKIKALGCNEERKTTSKNFLKMEKILKEKFGLEYKKDEYNEISGYKNGKKVVTYFHSHCRIRECDVCKQIHLRITANGKMKQCMYTTRDDIDTKKEDFKEKLKEYIAKPAKFYYN